MQQALALAAAPRWQPTPANQLPAAAAVTHVATPGLVHLLATRDSRDIKSQLMQTRIAIILHDSYTGV
jgi:hypothetical protein